MAKAFLLLCATTCFAIVSVPVLGGTPQASSPAAGKGASQAAADAQARAKVIYQVDCAMCHGANGNGKTDLATSMGLTLADWTQPATLADKSDQDLFVIIRKGKNKMPPEDAGRAKDDVVSALIVYIRGFSK